MADECDPAVLHARVSVLEANDTRHEASIDQLYSKVSALEICSSSLPKIEKNLEEIAKKVDALTAASQSSAGEKVAFLTLREWAIVALAALAFLMDHLVIK